MRWMTALRSIYRTEKHPAAFNLKSRSDGAVLHHTRNKFPDVALSNRGLPYKLSLTKQRLCL
jgi:hypothetical protein